MRILFIIRQLNYGGAQSQLITLANALTHHGHVVKIAVYYRQGEMEKLLDSNVQLADLKKHSRWDLLGPIQTLLRLTRDFQPDILHGYLSTSNFLALLVKLFLPKIPVVWGKRNSFPDQGSYDLFQRLLFRVEPFLAYFPDLIIFNSQNALQYALGKGYPPSKARVVNNGIDIEQFQINKSSGQRLRQKWGISDREPLCGIVGRIHPEKDHATFIKAAHLVRQQNPLVRFVCVGSGAAEYEEQLKKSSHNLGLDGKLLWAGAQMDMQAVYNALDFLVSSSVSESFPNVILEAMACGKPCLVTNVGDSAQIVGETGLVAPPRNPQALANGMEEMLARLEQITPGEIRARVIENFSVANLVRRTEDALMETLQR